MSDFNTMTESGIYTMTSNINSPVSGDYFYGMMLVMAGLYGYITQFAIATSGDIYCRTFNSVSWEEWKHITAT